LVLIFTDYDYPQLLSLTVNVNEGEDIHIPFNVSAHPTPDIILRKRGGAVPSNINVGILSINISQAVRNNAGLYSIVIMNFVDDTVIHFNLEVSCTSQFYSVRSLLLNSD